MTRNLVLSTCLGLGVGLAGLQTATAFSPPTPTFEKVVAAGHTLKVSAMSALDPTCRSLGAFTINLTNAPRAGRVEIAQGRDFPSFSALNTRSRCNTRKVPTTIVYYTAAAGYAGDDDFSIEIVDPQGNMRRARFHISVR